MKGINKVIVSAMFMTMSLPLCAHADYPNFGIWRDQYSDKLVLPQFIKATGERMFIFTPKGKQWAAYNEDGTLTGYGRANGGGHFCPDLGEACHTDTGKFRVFRKGSAGCVSNTFPISEGGGAAMPYCMFFNGGAAIHGSPQLSFNNSSHGCVRVTTPSAEWLSSNFMKVGTKVMVLSY